MIELVDKEECSTKGGTRIIDRKKLEDKNKEKSATKEIFKTRKGRYGGIKYKYLIYWDKEQNRQIQKRIKICKICGIDLTEQNRVRRYLICSGCYSKKKGIQI